MAESAKAAIEKRFGADYHLRAQSGTLDADLPKGGGADYMLMWTTLLEVPTASVISISSISPARRTSPATSASTATPDMAKLDAYFDQRVKSNPDFEKAVQNGLTKPAFRRYYALRASASVSRGAHDEWNIFRMINERRRADSKIGTTGQIPVLFDGRGVNPPDAEAAVSEGYVGKCAL